MNTKFSNEGYLFETAISNRTLNSVVCDLCISLSNRVNMHTRFLEKIGSASDILDEVARTKPNALIIATSANGYFGTVGYSYEFINCPITYNNCTGIYCKYLNMNESMMSSLKNIAQNLPTHNFPFILLWSPEEK